MVDSTSQTGGLHVTFFLRRWAATVSEFRLRSAEKRHLPLARGLFTQIQVK